MSQRLTSLTAFMMRNFFRSLSTLVPLSILALLYQIGFYFGGNQQYLVAVGGAGLIVVAIAVTLLLCWQHDRMHSYPLLSRLSWRGEFVLALLASALLITLMYALGFLLLLIAVGKVAPITPAIFEVVGRWLLLFLLFTTLSLHLSRLISRIGSYMFALFLIAIFISGLTSTHVEPPQSFSWLHLTQWITYPISVLLTEPVGQANWQALLWSTLGVLGYSALLLLFAVRLFQDKDLVWSE